MFSMQQIMYIPYGLLVIWLIFSIGYLFYSFSKMEKSNPYLVSSIPSVFTTIGVLGTFLGIYYGLKGFDVNQIDESIPALLEGLKTAFLTSIWGIGLSLFFSRVTEYYQKKYTSANNVVSDETSALNVLIDEIRELKGLISSDDSQSLSSQLLKVRESFRDELRPVALEITSLKNNIGGEEETSLLSQTRKFRTENYEQFHRLQELMKEGNKSLSLTAGAVRSSKNGTVLDKMNKLVNITTENANKQENSLSSINQTMERNRKLMIIEFEKFSDLLAKNNTEILVEAIENVIGNFNEKLNELLGRLVKENFEQLNDSVQKLNQWQEENKAMVERLVGQFNNVASDFEKSSTSMVSIAQSTQTLTKEDSKLVLLIKELDKVLLTENKFVSSIEQLNNVTASYESTWDKADRWMQKHRNFSDAIENLIDKLKEIEALRNETDGFFNDIKSKLNENINILEGGNQVLIDRVNTIENSFQERLNISFRSLDKILQSMVLGYAQKMNNLN